MTRMWTLYTLALRQHLHGKRWLVMGLLFLMPAAMAALLRYTSRDVGGRTMEFILIFMFIPQALLPLSALIYASGMIQDEQEEQTITYLLIRPIPKWMIYLIKLLAALTTTIVLTTVFTALTYFVIYVGRDLQGENIPLRFLQAASIHALAVSCYCCIFGLMSLITKRYLITGILYIAVVEGLFANLAFGIRLLTVIYYTRLIAYRTLPFVVSNFGGTENIAADAWQLDIRHDPNLLEHPQPATCLAVLLIGSLILAILAAVICSQREFHVKTPEKN
jgi:ABC-2 type transport system permease protein